MPFQKGDYILLEYTVVDKDDNKVVETTVEDKAKEAGIYRPDEVYEPRLIIIGETKLFEPLEQAIMNSSEGQEITVEIPPDKAFGQRDPSKVRVISIREFYRYGKLPRVGDVVEVNNQQGRVVSITGGRVTLDFNHPLAGKTLIVTAKVIKKLETTEDKVKYIIKQYIPRIEINKVRVELGEGGSIVTIKLPIETLFMENIGTIKARIADDIGSRFTGVNKVVFVDEIEIKREAETKPAEAKAEEKQAESKPETQQAQQSSQ
ncbi:peptidylprolyl isomerase [Vulcanisaeta distributa]|uniref:peptidylprolyl isomerase n=1 Tax=Vulcanisaeta distributa (strain DSM 14429 / JCM 11212 / NBRC 100878 / IC-017) TaxID=572478 RepID=E1QR17_VULDI|nr:peptidylprolyl isomerase [Vulcanisaeta distributa]ADN51707.1 peptidylprolyl isomerase FKBP-type [Vulcanisaeta distributa DSM 14429]